MLSRMVLIALILLIPTNLVFGAQLDARIPRNVDAIEPSFKFLRVVIIDYPDGGDLANLLQGKQEKISFIADSQTSGILSLIQQLNTSIKKSSSHATITDAKIVYQATLDGKKGSAVIEYKIELILTVTDYIIRQAVPHSSQVEQEVSALLDSHWRGISITEPIVLQTEYGSYDVNDVSSVLKVVAPEVLEKIQDTDAKKVLDQKLLDASGIQNLPLTKWHKLFDPTALQEDAKKMGFTGNTVISQYSMGECNIEIGPCTDKKTAQQFTLDKKYTIRSIESQDQATLAIEGYVTSTKLADIEVFGVNSKIPDDFSDSPTGEFPVSIIYGMATMAGIGAIALFWFSNRQLKKDQGGQRGIDPALLQVRETSSSSGGYKTNRGEAYLPDSKEIPQRTMPKGWKSN